MRNTTTNRARPVKGGQEGFGMEVTEMRFQNILSAVEFAEENIKDGFEIIRQDDGSYIVKETK